MITISNKNSNERNNNNNTNNMEATFACETYCPFENRSLVPFYTQLLSVPALLIVAEPKPWLCLSSHSQVAR